MGVVPENEFDNTPEEAGLEFGLGGPEKLFCRFVGGFPTIWTEQYRPLHPENRYNSVRVILVELQDQVFIRYPLALGLVTFIIDGHQCYCLYASLIH